ncbi:MAG: M64 family metallo-endopeptidase [Candidatus Aminicenantes bacterium]|nr:M64 family metallo-endopeptidase [Candidatus Aminicenantes bacterium]
MKTKILLACIVLYPVLASAQGDVDFTAYFADQTMRIDVHHGGDAKQEALSIDKIYIQGPWAGNPRRLTAAPACGRYLLQVFAAADGALIYRKGFDSYFGEYKTTEPAAQGVAKIFSESLLVPCPKGPVRLEVALRDRQNQPQPIFKTEINPQDVYIVREKLGNDVLVIEQLKNGAPADKADLAILAEGYTAAEEGKFRQDLARFSALLLSQEPYKTFRDRFNIYGLFKASLESGCDEPGYGTFKNTALGASFDSFGSERYLLTEDNRAMRDIAAHVPYDAILILVNHPRYGGGGIYNLYCTFTSDDQWRDYLLMHEFGHSFSGLADEYYTSAVAYNEFYPPGVEPLEANITALLDPKNVKWKELVTKKTAVPTPWEKAAFEAMDKAYQKKRQETNEKIAALKRANAAKEEIDALQARSDEMSRLNGLDVNAFFKQSRFNGKVGAFEGAGYAAKGLYRPMLDCLMFSRGLRPLCKVCERAVIDTIRYYSE